MPTYAYKCDYCEHEFELFQSITAKPIRKCPQCSKHKVRRLIGTGAGILFKGSGFYETDYRSDSYQKAAKEETKTSTETKDKKSTSSESKSETQKETTSPKTDTPKSDKKKTA